MAEDRQEKSTHEAEETAHVANNEPNIIRQNNFRKLGNNPNGKLLYDPNRRMNYRLGDFDFDEEEDLEEETEEETIDESDELPKEEEVEQKDNNPVEQAVETGTDIIQKTEKVKRFAKIAGFIASNPWIIIALGVVVLLLFIIFLSSDDDSDNVQLTGIAGYEYYPGACDEVFIQDNFMTVEEYVEAVVAGEVGNGSPETQKEIAIAARTFLLQKATKIGEGDDCYYDANEVSQSYRPENINENVKAAVEATKGLIILLNGIPKTYYDASCVLTAAQAEETIPGGNYSEDYYYILHGDWLFSTPLLQAIPKEHSDIGTMASYVEAAENNDIPEDSNCPLRKNHGGGISQNGSYYLEQYSGYKWEDLINYYYRGEYEIASIYPYYNAVGSVYNWVWNISNDRSSIYANLEFLNEPLNQFLTEEEYNALNQIIYAEVMEYGPATRSAIVAAAVTPINYIAANYGKLIPYTYSGQHGGGKASTSDYGSISFVDTAGNTLYGVHPYWGMPIVYKGYDYYGPDCTGFAAWVYHNAGINTSIFYSGDYVTALGGKSHVYGGDYIAQPGDAVGKHYVNPDGTHSGHVAIVVGVDEDNDRYYIAHAAGGQEGVKINTLSMSNTEYQYIVDISPILEKNKTIDFETKYLNGVMPYNYSSN